MSNIFWNCALKYGVVLSCPPRLFPHGSVLQAPYIYIYIYIHTYGIFLSEITELVIARDGW